MFDLVMTVSSSDAIRAVHEASRRLTQRERLEYIRETAAFPVTENKLAAQLLTEIEEAEGKELADLTKPETDRYVVEMSDLLSTRLKAEFPLDEAHGRQILAEMRAAYEERYPARR